MALSPRNGEARGEGAINGGLQADAGATPALPGRSAVFLDAASGVSEAPFSLEAGFGGNAALPEAGLRGGLLHASTHRRARPVAGHPARRLPRPAPRFA